MKKIKLFSFASMALVSLTQPTWAGPHGGGGGFSGCGRFGGFRTAPNAFRGATFTGRSTGGLGRAPQVQYGGGRMSAVRQYGFAASASRPTISYAVRRPAVTDQQDRVGSMARTSGVRNSRV